jgi:predicted RNA methylase
MAADIGKIISQLREFADVSGRTMITVGAGGGQFIEFGRTAKSVLAVDNDPAALDKLRQNLSKAGLLEKFTLVQADFKDCRLQGDIVMFEFCLHEMPDPGVALGHAFELAPRILVADHWPESEWAFFVDEQEKATRSWAEVRKIHPEKIQTHEGLQVFKNYQELFDKVKGQGETALRRIERFKDATDFSIPMTYGFALI